MPAVTVTDLNNAKLDCDTIGAFTTGTANTTTDRLGGIKKTLAGVSADVVAKVALVEVAKNNALIDIPAKVALIDTTVAATAAGQATAARIAAETARDAANVNGKIYATTAAGLAAVASGGYFSVPSPDTAEHLILYENVAGVATERKRYPSSAIFDNGKVLGYQWGVVDSAGKAAIGVRDDGTFSAAAADFAVLRAGNVAFDSQAIGATALADIPDPYYVWSVRDANGNVAGGFRKDGVFEVQSLVSREQPAAPPFNRYGGLYTHQINFISTSGQSLGEGSTPATAVTTVQEYDNIGFPAYSVSPATFVPLTVANTQVGTRGESPMYGTLGHIKALIASENGLSYGTNDYQLVGCNNAQSGQSITQLYKGTSHYTQTLSQVQAAFDISKKSGRTMAFQAVTWTQGEADSAMAKDTYKGYLKQMIADYNADGKAITGQVIPVRLITYQTASSGTIVPLAQLEASNESAIIHMACPMYQFDYGDALHIDATSSKWLGGYYGLTYKRVIIDRLQWAPLQPVGHAVNGNTVDLIFNKSGLVLDTTLIPAQINSGFDVKDASNSTVVINAVALIAPNRVRLTLASNPAPGWAVRYGFNTATGKGPFTGGCGNLRDSQGDQLVYTAINKPMHNWCVIFNYSL